MRYVLFTIAFITFFSAPDSLDKGLGAWIALVVSAAYMIWMIRAEEKRVSLHKRKALAYSTDHSRGDCGSWQS